jgi:DNA-binding transcriptional regulator YhcF (GntR family)
MEGWIKLYRSLLDKPIWNKSTTEQKVVLITILLDVNHDTKEWEWKGEKFNILPGQTITSLENLALKAGVSIQNVRSALKRFEKLEFLTNESTKTGRLITVLNWGIYQEEFETPNKATNKDLTKTQQRPNKEVTTNKNDKNDKNDKNEFIFMGEPIKKFTPPTIEDVKNYIEEKGYAIDAEYFVAYYETRDWKVGKNKMKNWKAAIVTWSKNDKQHTNNFKTVEKQEYRHPFTTIFSDEVTNEQIDRFERNRKNFILSAQNSKDDT